MNSTTKFTFLHITDLHLGETNQQCLWPNLEKLFFEDLEKLVTARKEPIDIVFFSGDLVFSGSKVQYAKLDVLLAQLYEEIAKIHTRLFGKTADPCLLCVPGNHDLERPDANLSEALLLTNWTNNPALHQRFWSNVPDCPLHAVVRKAFSNYSAWESGKWFGETGRKQAGMLPGDFRAQIEKDGVCLGVVGLNTAFLHLGEGDFMGKLAVSPKQVAEAYGDDFTEWFEGNKTTFLVTHHPPDWLAPPERKIFDREISPSGRFALHLCGHMHQGYDEIRAVGGAEPKHQLQGYSLFGLEKRNGTEMRSHGYSLGIVEFSHLKTKPMLRIWPRVAKPHAHGWRIVPDHDAFVLGDDEGTNYSDYILWIKEVGDSNVPRSNFTAAKSFYEQAMKDVIDAKMRADWKVTLAHIANQSFEFNTAQLYEEALEMYREIGDIKGQADCIAGLGDSELLLCRGKTDLVVNLTGHYTTYDYLVCKRVRGRYEEARQLYNSVSHVLGEWDCVKRFGDLALACLQNDEAYTLFNEALGLCQIDDDFVLPRANCTKALGDVLLRGSQPEDLERARQYYEDAQMSYRLRGAARGEANCIKGLGDAALCVGDQVSARKRFNEALAIYQQLSPPNYYSIGMTQCALARVSLNRSEHDSHLRLARAAWHDIGRKDLVALLGDYE